MKLLQNHEKSYLLDKARGKSMTAMPGRMWKHINNTGKEELLFAPFPSGCLAGPDGRFDKTHRMFENEGYVKLS